MPRISPSHLLALQAQSYLTLVSASQALAPLPQTRQIRLLRELTHSYRASGSVIDYRECQERIDAAASEIPAPTPGAPSHTEAAADAAFHALEIAERINRMAWHATHTYQRGDTSPGRPGRGLAEPR